MKIKLNYIYLIIITLLISLLIFGYLLNKKSSASKMTKFSLWNPIIMNFTLAVFVRLPYTHMISGDILISKLM